MFGKKDLINFSTAEEDIKYRSLKLLGEGGFAKVYLAENTLSGEVCALKRIQKHEIKSLLDLKSELEILSRADNPNIISIYEIIKTPDYIDIITEYCAGGTLREAFNFVVSERQCFSEYQSSLILKQVLLALNYAHMNGIVHRDVKMENIMFVQQSFWKDLDLKLIDFGLATSLEKGKRRLFDRVGTMQYVSPEVLDGNYNEKCDIWACGVMLFALILGYFPFDPDLECDNEKIQERIMNFDYSFDNQYGGVISDTAKDLIKKMFLPEKQRISAAEALNHPFITENQSQKALGLKDSYSSYIFNLNNWMHYSHIKKVILTSIASRSNYSEIGRLHEIFNSLDTNNDGTISYAEFETGLKRYNKESEKLGLNLSELFKSIDTDDSKQIDYTEFIAAAMDRKFFEDKNKLLETFQMLDTNKDGKISFDEFERILHMHQSSKGDKEKDKQLYDIYKKEFEHYDLNKDGKIDYNEFVEIVLQRKDKLYPKKKHHK